MSKGIIIIGSGAQAKYASEIFKLKRMSVIGLLALSGENNKESALNTPVLGNQDDFEHVYETNGRPLLLLATSSNRTKEKLVERLSEYDPEYVNAIHPSAIIATSAVLGRGIIANANAVIQPYATIGDYVMIHAGVIIDHDCVIHDFVNLGPRVTLAGHVKIGKCATLYTGSVVIPSITIGEYSTVGAGGVVLQDIGNKQTAVGIPARIIKKDNETTP